MEIAKAIFHIHPKISDSGCVFFKNILIEHFDCMTKNDRVGDLHHGCFHVKGKKKAFFFSKFDLLGKESAQCLNTHESAVKHLAIFKCKAFFESRHRTVHGDEFDFHSGCSRDRN